MHRSMFVILTSPYGSCALHVYEHVCISDVLSRLVFVLMFGCENQPYTYR